MPACEAITVHVPELSMVTTPALTEQTSADAGSTESVTVKPEVALTEIALVLPTYAEVNGETNDKVCGPIGTTAFDALLAKLAPTVFKA